MVLITKHHTAFNHLGQKFGIPP